LENNAGAVVKGRLIDKSSVKPLGAAFATVAAASVDEAPGRFSTKAVVFSIFARLLA